VIGQTTFISGVGENMPTNRQTAIKTDILDIPNYSDMFDYIKRKQPAVYFKN